MKINPKDFHVRERDEVDLKKMADPGSIRRTDSQYLDLLREHGEQLSFQQQLLYASNRHAVLLIFQAMDAAGKDGAIRHVTSGFNPQGCQVLSFRVAVPADVRAFAAQSEDHLGRTRHQA